MPTCNRCEHEHHGAHECRRRFRDASDGYDTCICPHCECSDCRTRDRLRQTRLFGALDCTCATDPLGRCVVHGSERAARYPD